MTTTVTIISARPNHENVLVEQIDPATGKATPACTVLGDGGKLTAYVHNGAELRISELAKHMSAPTPVTRGLTYGEKAVGLTFNPSGDPQITSCKEECAAVIDRMNHLRAIATDPEVKRLASTAITLLQTGQMWAVKALAAQADASAAATA
jgi:hypothetical protein